MIQIKIHFLDGYGGLFPAFSTAGDVGGADLFCPYDRIIPSRAAIKIPLGFALEIPTGYEAQVKSRTDLACNGVTVLNSPATLSSSYRDEISVLLQNHRILPYTLRPGDRIALLAFSPVIDYEFISD